MTLSIDYTNMMAAAVEGALSPAHWTDGGARFREAHADVRQQRERGELGFFDLPRNAALHQSVTRFVQQCRGTYNDVVLLGIGGSALGPIALRSSLRPPLWNTLDAAHRQGFPRLHVVDNVDPDSLVALLQRLHIQDTLFIVISKSGGTAETMAQYLVVRGHLEKVVPGYAWRHLAFVTDPAVGALRAIARSENVPAFDIPPNVGGRFSVLSPVGTLPASLIGVDTTGLLAGAADMAERCDTDDLAANPAGVFATLQWLADVRLGRHIHVLMPYADALRDFAGWFVQLWAESLGKRLPDGSSVGPTPLAALGATDQHSQVQLFMEGPADKTVAFVSVRERSTDATIPMLHADVRELAYLGGHTLGELLDVERRATAGALARRGRPNLTIRLDRVDAWHVGSLIMLLEIATIYAGRLYGVNPLDQPGVELGKQFTYAMLGRADAEEARKEWNLLPNADPRWTV